MSLDEFRSKRIRVFRNGDLYEPGKKLVINTRVYRNFEQFLSRLSDEINLVNGAVRKVFTLDGHIIRTLDDLKDGAVYVATGGESFKKVPYLITADIPPSAVSGMTNGDSESREKSALIRTKRPSGWGVNIIKERFGTSKAPKEVQERRKKEPERPIFGPTSKAYKVTVFTNGDGASAGIKMILNYRNCRTFDQLLKNLTELLRISVRRLYDAENGHKISNLRQIHDGQNLVAAVADGFKQTTYHIEHPAQANKHEDDFPRVVTFFPNGDLYHIGQTVTVTKKRFPNLQRLLENLNTQIHLVTGMIQKLYALDGHRIQSVDELTHNGAYVVVSNNDPFIRGKYNVNAPIVSEHPVKGLAGQTQRNEFMAGIRKLPKKGHPAVTEEATEDEESDSGRGRRLGEMAARIRKKVKAKRSSSQPPHVPENELVEPAAHKKVVSKQPNSKQAPAEAKRVEKVEQAKPKKASEQVARKHDEGRDVSQTSRTPVETSQERIGSPHKYRKIYKSKEEIAEPAAVRAREEEKVAPVTNKGGKKQGQEQKDEVEKTVKSHPGKKATNAEVHEDDEETTTVRSRKQKHVTDDEEEILTGKSKPKKAAAEAESENDEEITTRRKHIARPPTEVTDHQIEEIVTPEPSSDAHEVYGESGEVRVMQSNSHKSRSDIRNNDSEGTTKSTRKLLQKSRPDVSEDEAITTKSTRKLVQKSRPDVTSDDESTTRSTRTLQKSRPDHTTEDESTTSSTHKTHKSSSESEPPSEHQKTNKITKKKQPAESNELDNDDDEETSSKLTKLNELGSRASLRLSQTSLGHKPANDHNETVITKHRKKGKNNHTSVSGVQTEGNSDEEDNVDEREWRKVESREGYVREAVPALPNKSQL
ncbi:uncharacterized protein SPPG_06019 [Spizellomyces punctatus DAOM BR117]|uniref:Doublecortin domain-containing protein n=1 Tax=Spizellomyces punctatus (strain DAOM BR117) TaxID=645134 RepID=A0A0L0HDL0_SPIPD|nr:uncharacterized protein SPPG_06019 [Spizellomyces punctatus DAOM BR117]KNC99071.1 hypothetical protein SPPG_06019 [Spizellomyces punctatus DAOM BR117]|eukprot:XP_016607111.1 hypothetical protein SPPG_06019 [Spizellomyces punctatus DAOM BR117]